MDDDVPLAARPAGGDDERRIHDSALQHVSKFGDFGVHACGLAAGDLRTLDRFLKANKGVRHQFFAGHPRRHIAALLDLEGAGAAPVLATMKLASPFEDSASENIKQAWSPGRSPSTLAGSANVGPLTLRSSPREPYVQ